MRKTLISLATAIAAIGLLAPIAAWAVRQESGQEFARVDRQDFVWRTSPVTTSSSEWESIPKLRLTTCNRGGLTINFSGDFSGAPVDLRVVLSPVGADPKVLIPGETHFDPGQGTSSFSFTFARDHNKRDHRTYDVQWRSSAGKEVTLNHALARVLYNLPNKLCA